MKFKSDRFGPVSGSASTRPPPTPARTSAACGPPAASGSRRPRSPSETASGWQTVTFSTPGRGAAEHDLHRLLLRAQRALLGAPPDYFWRAPAPGPNGGAVVDAAPLHALRNTRHDAERRLRATAPPSTFPINSFGAANYWVDVDCSRRSPAPGTVTGVTATSRRPHVGERDSGPPRRPAARATSYKVTPYIGATAQTPTTVTGSPPATSTTVTGLTTGTTYTFRVQAINPSGDGPASAPSNAVTPLNPVAPSAPPT